MKLMTAWYETYNMTDYAVFVAFVDLLSESSRDVEQSKGVEAAISYCLYYLASQPDQEGRTYIEKLQDGEVSEDELTEILMDELNKHMIELTLESLTSDGLVDVFVDEEGEFKFTLSDEGKKLAEKLKEEE